MIVDIYTAIGCTLVALVAGVSIGVLLASNH
jgi:hypothetical protein